MVGEQQRPAHPTCDRSGRVLHHDRSGRYPRHLAPWFHISSAQLHGSDDHIHCHVHLHGGLLDGQLGVPMATEPFESGKEANDEKGG